MSAGVGELEEVVLYSVNEPALTMSLEGRPERSAIGVVLSDRESFLVAILGSWLWIVKMLSEGIVG